MKKKLLTIALSIFMGLSSFAIVYADDEASTPAPVPTAEESAETIEEQEESAVPEAEEPIETEAPAQTELPEETTTSEPVPTESTEPEETPEPMPSQTEMEEETKDSEEAEDEAEVEEETEEQEESVDLPAITMSKAKKAAAAPVIQVPTVSYSAHLSNIGWVTEVSNGTATKDGRMEALKIRLSNTNISGDIVYQAHVQNVGWMSQVSNNAISGTTGRSLQMEAVRISLSGDLTNYFNVFYRTYVQSIGWTDWTSNGASSGSAGYTLPIKNIEIKVLLKTDSSIVNGVNPYYESPGMTYKSHVQNIGWQGSVSAGNTSGTSGQSLRMEAIQVTLPSNLLSQGNINVRAHVQNIGWTNDVHSGAVAGTTGQSLRVEAVCISLTGSLASQYDIYYRVHAQNYGWLAWTSNGQPAGTAGKSLRLEAIQIVMIKKDGGTNLYQTGRSFIGNYGQGFGTASVNGRSIKVYYDANSNIVKSSFKINNVYYYVDSNTGEILHEQGLTNSKIWREGIDISEWNGGINLANYQDGFIIIRASWGTNKDQKAEAFMTTCDQLHIPYGVYCYSYALSDEDAAAEAEYLLKIIKGHNISCGVWFDMEDADGYKARHITLTKSTLTSFCKTFCSKIAKAGYHTGVYASYNWFGTYIGDYGYDKWVAHWGQNTGSWTVDMSNFAGMHQYTSNPIDKDVMYVDPKNYLK